MPTTTLGIKVDETTKERLKALAKARDRSPHWLVKQALALYLEREEQVERERAEDEARWARYALTGEAIPHEEVRDWLRRLSEGEDAPCPG